MRTEGDGSTQTLVLGGGFGGIAAANTLRRLLPAGHAITVIDQSPRFHVGPGKTWVMLGERTPQEIAAERTDPWSKKRRVTNFLRTNSRGWPVIWRRAGRHESHACERRRYGTRSNGLLHRGRLAG